MASTSSTVNATRARIFLERLDRGIPVSAASCAAVRPSRASVARTSAATYSRASVGLMGETLSLFRDGRKGLDTDIPKWVYIAGELRAQKSRMKWTLDELVEMSGLARSTIDLAMKGEGGLSVETLIPLTQAMRLESGAGLLRVSMSGFCPVHPLTMACGRDIIDT